MENTHKRVYRQLGDSTKQKISQSLRGRSKSISHKDAISNGLRIYWETIPNKPTDEKKVEEK